MTAQDAPRRPPAPPAHLTDPGRAFWGEVTAVWDLRPDEVRVLEAACGELDVIARIEAELTDTPLTARGAQGQPVAAPLLTEVRQHRAALASLLRQLHLPDAEGADSLTAASVSASARRAARARWDRRDGRRGA